MDTPGLRKFLQGHSISRRGFLKFCSALTTMMALPPAMASTVAAKLEQARRPSVIWLSFQECTGCTESLTRSHAQTVESLIFDYISLDYHHTLQVASGEAAEKAREIAMHENKGKYIVIVDGSIPLANPGYSTIAGMSNKDILMDTVKDAAAVVAIGSCAAFGGLPHASPNPTGAVPVSHLVKDKPVINVSGCPPIPVVITSVLAHFLVMEGLPELDSLNRPKLFYGQSIHDRCYRRPFYDKGLFAQTFDDEGARKGWCLYRLGCKGPMTYNACATHKWNENTSWPVEAGHGCLGCSEPDFWDAGSFYKPLSVPLGDITRAAGYAVAGGVLAGAAVGLASRHLKSNAKKAHRPVTVDELNEEK